MADKFALVILAAGQGTRLKLNCPKALAPVMGRSLIDYVIDGLCEFKSHISDHSRIGVVTGHMRERVENHLKNSYGALNIDCAFQEKQLGTADALKAFYKGCSWGKDSDYTLITCADTPLIRAQDLQKLYQIIQKDNLDAVAATFCEENPHGYGRIIRSKTKSGFHIVEEKDADSEQKKVNEVNSGLYIIKTSFVLNHIEKLSNNNKSGEFYLTDLFQDDFKVSPVLFDHSELFLGVNNLEQLETAQRLLGKRKVKKLQASGVRFLDSSSVLIDESVEIGAATTIYPQVSLHGKTVIGEGVVLEQGVVIKDSVLEGPLEIKAYSYLEECKVKANASVGPFARLRPGADIGSKAKVGNFVEIKKSILHQGAKVSHLSYVGDAEIGENSNIGCGFITCNYDGAKKHKTVVGKNTFIGSDSQAVAPVSIGDNCFVACATTVTDNMPDGSFSISRNRQTTKPGLAHKFLKKKD